MKSFTEIFTWIALSIGFIEYDPVDDETPCSENPEIATQENNFQPPAQVPDDQNFRYVPSPPLCSNRPVYQANSDVIIDMPADDKPHGVPDSNTRYGFSLGLTGNSDKKYWNGPPYVFVPPPYRPTVSYVPTPPPEHLEADRYEKQKKKPAAENDDEDLTDLFAELPDSNTRYGFSLGQTGTSGIKKYWNDPPYVFVPPPHRPTVSYVPTPTPEHLEADRYEKQKKKPAAENGHEDLIDLFTELPITNIPCFKNELDRINIIKK
ncbi:hypothetical protein GHT06_008774 [Daphnia sinensis]|uniref:Uncharacterized protein n=1 Tax=Daphnia sinensis TaxID=1820382 RepID=A0AAD5LLQ8_9CRUS|nr:hypothetical protein GHT06_008774 [Daphnia sinensis]